MHSDEILNRHTDGKWRVFLAESKAFELLENAECELACFSASLHCRAKGGELGPELYARRKKVRELVAGFERAAEKYEAVPAKAAGGR